MTHGFARVALGALMLLGAQSVMAQDDSDLTAEELAARFQAQSEQLTRGLVIAPSSAEPISEAAAAALPEEAAYVAVDPSAQVNIQIAFAFDSAAIDAGEAAKLSTLCDVMKASDIPTFKIIGHTDAAGSEGYNQNLSRLRAEEVKRHLVDVCGMEPARLLAEGMGEAFPVDASNPRADANRRVEFQVGS